MKGKILIIFFVALFCLSSIPYLNNTVSALSITYSFGFEDTVAGNPITEGLPVGSDNIFTSDRVGAEGVDFATSSSGSRSGSRCFYVDTAEGYFNATYSTSNYLTNFSFYIYPIGGSGAGYLRFGNRTFGYTDPIIKLQFSSWELDYLNENNDVVKIGDIKASRYSYISFNIDNSNGDVSYTLDLNVTSGVARKPAYISSGYRIDMIWFGYLAHAFKIDDLNYTLSDSYTSGGSGGECGYDLNDYSKIGVDNTPSSLTVSGYQMMKIYNVLTTGTLKGVSLCVAPEQYEDDSNVDNYTVKILGYDEQSADCFYNDGFNYRLFWSCDIDLGEEIPNQQNGYILYAQFFHRKLLSGFYNTYWLPCIGSSPTVDLDNDGDIYFKYGNTDGVPQSTYNYDLGVSFYLTKESTLPNIDTTDSLGLHNWISKNTTGYLYELGQPEGIVCSYILGDSAYTYKIEVYHNSTLFKTYNNLNFPAGINGFIPILTGIYTFKLYSFHYVYNVTAYVSGSLPSDFFLATEPLFTKPYEAYNIYYKFYHLQGYDGQIGIFNDNSLSNDLSEAYTTFGFPNNQSGTIPYDSTSLTNEYLTLFVDNSPFNAVYHTTHYINNPSIVGTWDLSLSRDTLQISRGNPENLNVSINGFHPFLATDTGIYIDGIKRYDLRETQVFSVYFTPHDSFSHRYNISLETRQDNGMVILKTVFLTVTIEDGGEPVNPVVDLLPPPFSYIAGAIITLMFTIAPVVLIGKLGVENSIMQYIPIFTGLVGFILSCLVGFFPWYAIFGLVLILVLVIVVMWQRNKG